MAAYHGLREDPRLERDAASLHSALSELIRVFQFRDRDLIGDRDISVTQYHALEAMEEGGALSLNDLAARLILDKSTTSRVVDALERKGLAGRSPNPNDRRALLLSVTEKGLALLEEIKADVLAEEKALLSEFEPAMRREMTRLIARLSKAAVARVDTTGGTCNLIG